MEQENVIVIDGPIVTFSETTWFQERRFSSQIVYSIQLANGLIVTSPESFPVTPSSSAAQETQLLEGERIL
jgi:hypothetical protein